jgi:hypothetical protein
LLSLLVGLALAPAAANAQPGAAAWTRFLDLRCYQIPNQPALLVPLTLSHLNPVLVEMGLKDEDVILGQPNQLCLPVRKNAQAIPFDVFSYLRWLDLKCYQIDGPPVDVPLHLDHLNPAIPPLFGPGLDVKVREPQQLCVPVRKNNTVPPAAVLDLIQWVDLKCYRVETDTVNPNVVITLRHLNPLFSTIPAENTPVFGPFPTKLCVPVAKDGKIPPDSVIRQVSYSDVLCYRAGGLQLNQNLTLHHLNPVLQGMGLPPEFVPVTNSQELCVPVAKNGDFPPP